MSKKILLIIIFFTLVLNNTTKAQLPSIFGGSISRGFIFAHVKDMRYFINKNITQYNINIGYQTNGEKNWHLDWRNPEYGLGFYYADLGNPEVLGNSKAAYFYFNTPLLWNNFISTNFYVGLGTAYLSKCFDNKTNNVNIAIGSHLNIYANVNLRTQIKTNKIIYYTDFGITHYSNGGTVKPNLGINVPALSLGIKYKTHNIEKVSKMFRSFKPYNDIQIVQAFSVRGSSLSYSLVPKPVIVFTADFGRYIERRLRLAAGIDIIYDGAAEYKLKAKNIENYTKTDYISAGLHCGASVLIGDFQFAFQQVIMLYQNYGFYKHWQRYGFRYILAKKYIIGATLSTHFFQALFIEPGLGIRLNLN